MSAILIKSPRVKTIGDSQPHLFSMLHFADAKHAVANALRHSNKNVCLIEIISGLFSNIGSILQMMMIYIADSPELNVLMITHHANMIFSDSLCLGRYKIDRLVFIMSRQFPLDSINTLHYLVVHTSCDRIILGYLWQLFSTSRLFCALWMKVPMRSDVVAIFRRKYRSKTNWL